MRYPYANLITATSSTLCKSSCSCSVKDDVSNYLVAIRRKYRKIATNWKLGADLVQQASIKKYMTKHHLLVRRLLSRRCELKIQRRSQNVFALGLLNWSFKTNCPLGAVDKGNKNEISKNKTPPVKHLLQCAKPKLGAIWPKAHFLHDLIQKIKPFKTKSNATGKSWSRHGRQRLRSTPERFSLSLSLSLSTKSPDNQIPSRETYSYSYAFSLYTLMVGLRWCDGIPRDLVA
jgi:hypothetical protein